MRQTWGQRPIFVLCVLTVAAPVTARAQENGRVPTPPSLRLHVDGSFGHSISDLSRWPDGSTTSLSCSPLAFACGTVVAVGIGVDWAPFHHVSLGLRGRWFIPGASYSDNTNMLGRHLDVVEALLVPQLRLPWKWRIPRGGARPYLTMPVGVAWSYESRNWTRAVTEDWRSRPGLSAGAAVGIELFWGRRLGTLLELGYQARFLSADVVSTPVDEPQAQVSERVTTTQHQLLFSLGILFGLQR